jgi:hypothetical protein
MSNELSLTDAGRSILVKKRRAVLMSIVNETAKNGNRSDVFSRADLFYRVTKEPFIAEYFPHYSIEELGRDLSIIGKAFDRENADLRLLFLSENITDTQEAIAILKDFATDNELPIVDRIKALNSLKSYIELQLNILGNMPDKRVSIDQRVVKYDLEDFLRIQEMAQREMQQKREQQQWHETNQEFEQLFLEGEIIEEEE